MRSNRNTLPFGHRRRWTLLPALILAGSSLSAQIEEEDLEIEESPISFEVEQAFAEAVALFDTTDQAESLPLFSQVIDELTPLSLAGDPVVLETLQEALLYRIRGRFNFGESEGASEDMAQLVEMKPELQLDRAEVSSRLADLYDDVRNQKVGFLALDLEPLDARIVVQGRELPLQTTPYALLIGTYTTEIRRPGFTSASLAFEIKPNETFEESLALDRVSALVALRTRPSDARILIDGVEVARTTGQAPPSFAALGDASKYPGTDFSEESLIDGITIGSHTLEILKPGYRPFRTALDVNALEDYRFEPVLLEAEQGALELRSVPADAEVYLNDTRNPTRPDGNGTVKLTLSPGNYRVTVARGSAGRFEGTVDVLDRSSVTLDVKLRPALTLLGILGNDDVAAQRLRAEIGDAFRRADNWIVLDRSADAEASLTSAGLDTATLRRAVAGGASQINWAEVQEWADETYRGSAYAIGVLADDLIADEADLWILPAAPGPARADRRRVNLSDNLAIPTLAAGFATEFQPVRATFGLTFIDSELASGPVVASVATGSAAERANVQIGSTVLEINGEVTADAAAARAALDAAAVDAPLQLRTSSSAEPLSLQPDRSWTVIDPADPDVVFPAVAANINAELERTSEWPRWLLQLNQAALLLRAGDAEEAIRTLRKVDQSSITGTGPTGLGRASVDYLLGVALTQAGPRYLETAREAFARAAGSVGERLHHNDGPLLAPRARARLERLGGAL